LSASNSSWKWTILTSSESFPQYHIFKRKELGNLASKPGFILLGLPTSLPLQTEGVMLFYLLSRFQFWKGLHNSPRYFKIFEQFQENFGSYWTKFPWYPYGSTEENLQTVAAHYSWYAINGCWHWDQMSRKIQHH
jgi:hypothetical protein